MLFVGQNTDFSRRQRQRWIQELGSESVWHEEYKWASPIFYLFTSLPLSLISQGSLKLDESMGCLSLRVEVKVPMIFDFGLTMQCWFPCPWKQLQKAREFETCVSYLSRGITCFTFITATTQASHLLKRGQWKKSMATVSGTMWISWISFEFHLETQRVTAACKQLITVIGTYKDLLELFL